MLLGELGVSMTMSTLAPGPAPGSPALYAPRSIPASDVPIPVETAPAQSKPTPGSWLFGVGTGTASGSGAPTPEPKSEGTITAVPYTGPRPFPWRLVGAVGIAILAWRMLRR